MQRGSPLRSARLRKPLMGGLVSLIMTAVVLAASCSRPTVEETSVFSENAPPVLAPFPITIVPGIHLLGEFVAGVAYVVETSKGLVLVDSGMAADAFKLKQQMDKLGLDWKRIHAILITHGHADHCLGAQQLRNQTGAKIFAGLGDSAVIRAGGPRDAMFNIHYHPQINLHPTTVDVELKGGEALSFGDVTIEVLATPGHTPGGTCYLLKRKGLRALFTGDMIMQLSSDGTTGPLGDYLAYLPPRYRGDAKAFLTSLRMLRKLPVPNLVLPGHPNSDRPPQSPVLSSLRWHSILSDGIRAMEKLVARYHDDGACFLDGSPKQLLPDLYYLGDRDGVAVYAFFIKKKMFVVDAPGGAGLSAFLSARLEHLGVRGPAMPTGVLLTSCPPRATTSLIELIEKSDRKITVVASRAGISKLKQECPAGTIVVPADELSAQSWFPVKTIPLSDHGPVPVAYQLAWHKKKVLFSGMIPVGRIFPTEDYFRDLSESSGSLREYRTALNRLGRIKPDVWLPAVAVYGQNANMYEENWQQYLDRDMTLVDVFLRSGQ